MTAFAHRAVIITPAALADIAADIAQAMGPSERDDLSFNIRATRDGAEFVVCDVAITQATRDAYAAMQANPAMLHAGVVAGWSRKGMQPPPLTLTECAAWLSASTIWLGPAWALSGVSIDDVLAGLGYTRVQPPQVPLGQ